MDPSALIAGAQTLVARGLVVGTVGNVSQRQGERVLITPSRFPYEEMTTDDLVTVDLAGEKRNGSRPPSSELPLHLAIYRRRPDVRAVVHAHGPHATAWSFLGEPLRPLIEENSYLEIGEVVTNPPSPAGSHALAETAAAEMGESAAVLLSGHGLLAVGTSVREAVEIANAVEHQAQVALLLRAAGVRHESQYFRNKPSSPKEAQPCPH